MPWLGDTRRLDDAERAGKGSLGSADPSMGALMPMPSRRRTVV